MIGFLRRERKTVDRLPVSYFRMVWKTSLQCFSGFKGGCGNSFSEEPGDERWKPQAEGVGEASPQGHRGGLTSSVD